MPVTVKIDPNPTRQQAYIIPDATTKSDGVMTKEMAAKLAAIPDDGGGNKWNVVAVQVGGDTYSAQPNDYVPVDATGGNVSVVLPDATTCKGQSVALKDVAGGNVSAGIKLNTVDGQTIDGAASLTLSTISGGNNFAEVQVVSDGANWLVGPVYAGQP
jgi:hypothetical protein